MNGPLAFMRAALPRLNESLDQTTVADTSARIIDGSRRSWMISPTGSLLMGNAPVTGSSNVVQLAYVSHVVWIKTSLDNLVRNPTHAGLVVGNPGTLPTSTGFNVAGGFSYEVIGSGIDVSTGVSLWYYDIRFYTPTTASGTQMGFFTQTQVAAGAAITYTNSMYLAGIAGGFTAPGSVDVAYDCWSAPSSYISTLHNFAGPLTSTLTKKTAAAASAAGTTLIDTEIIFGTTAGTAYNFTIRIAGEQLTQPALANMWTPMSVVSGVATFGTETSSSPLASSTSGSPFGLTPPAGAIAITNSAGSIQAAINANPVNTAFTLAAGTWANQQFTPKAGMQFWGNSAGTTILDGGNSTLYAYSSDGSQILSGVLLKYLTFQHYGVSSSENKQGVIHACNGWTFDQCTFQNNANNGLVAYSASSSSPGWIEVYGGRYNSHGHSGIACGANLATGGSMTHLLIRGAEIAFNNTRGDNQDDDVGGMKLTVVKNGSVQNCYVHDNASDGIWFDIQCVDNLIEGNTVLNNAYWAIHYEISDGGVIRNNVLNDNGLGPSPGIGGGVYISESAGCEVYNNNIRMSGRGHGIMLQRSATRHSLTNNLIHNNTVTLKNAAPSSTQSVTGMLDDNSYPIGTTSINTNHYYVYTNGQNDVHWTFSVGARVYNNWANYRSATGQDAASDMNTGDASVPGITNNNANGSGWSSP